MEYFFLHAYIVVDLGFGDSGKGLLTDFLVRHVGAGVVVRYNGGAQAGHNVVTPDGRHHTFSQFGSGAFNPNVRTYLSRHVVVHPTALLIEGDALEKKGVREPFARLRVSEQALVITPFHQAANRIRESLRGVNRHGSCGVGVGEAVEDAVADARSSVLAGDLRHPALLRRKLESCRERKRDQIIKFYQETTLGISGAREFDIFERESVIDEWISSISRLNELGLIVSDAILERWLRETDDVVFEGAQGVLIDAETGFHPYTTWSNCTAANALDILQQLAPDAKTLQVGVLRSHAVRHGPGPLPTETDGLASLIAEHNQYNEWQGAVRYGWFDAVLARYALSVTSGIDFLTVTHLDMLSHLEEWRYCSGYTDFSGLDAGDIGAASIDGALTYLRYTSLLSLGERTQLTQALSKATPVLEACRAEEKIVIQNLERLVGKPVGIISDGPSAENVHILKSLLP